MKIEVWFLLRSRQAKPKKISEHKTEADFNNGIYLMNREAMNFYSKGGKPKGVETFFYEGNPAPIRIDEKGKDFSIKFLNNYIYENVIEQTGEIPKERLKNAWSFAKNNITIGGVVRWGLVLMVAATLIGGYLNAMG